MSKLVIAARNRESKGSGAACKIRRAGRIPAVLYGRSGKALSIDVDALGFANGIKTISASTIVKVEVEGKSYDAFVKDTQRNMVDGSILHVDFYEVESDTVVRARVSIHLKGNPAGVREGGLLETPLQQIEVECLPKDLPERIEMDISGLGVNQYIYVRNIPLASGVRVLTPADQPVALVKYAKDGSAGSGSDDAAGPAAAAPAAKS